MIPNQDKIFVHVQREVWICMFLVLVTLAVYFQVGNFDFTNYDTAEYVYENVYVKDGLTAESIKWAFSAIHRSNWHPVTWLSHMLDVQLFGLNPGAHHWTSVGFHLANTLLLFMVLRLMTGNIWRSGFVAALFAIHPLHVQFVKYFFRSAGNLEIYSLCAAADHWQIYTGSSVFYPESYGQANDGYVAVRTAFAGLLAPGAVSIWIQPRSQPSFSAICF